VFLYYGYGISYNLIDNSNSIVRLHLDLFNNYENSTEEWDRISTNVSNKRTHNDTNERDISRVALSLAPLYLYKFYKSEIGFAYFGGGPKLSYLYSKSEWDNSEVSINHSDPNDFYKTTYESKDKETQFTLGVVLIAGLQAKITKHFAVFAETHINVGKTWLNRTHTDYNDYTPGEFSKSELDSEGSSWQHDFQLSRIGISISI
jgi:hypothetical protein